MKIIKWREVIENVLKGNEIRISTHSVESQEDQAEVGVISLGEEEQSLLSNLILLALPSPSQHTH